MRFYELVEETCRWGGGSVESAVFSECFSAGLSVLRSGAGEAGRRGVLSVRDGVLSGVSGSDFEECAMSDELMDEEEQLAEAMAGFEFDPLGFVLFAFPWGEKGLPLENKKGPRKWQRKVLKRIGEKLAAGGELGAVVQEAVASGHGIGKSALISFILMWAMSTFEETRGMVTANTKTQLSTKTWPEVKKWFRMCITEHWFEFNATSIHSVDDAYKETWRIDAIPWSEGNSEAFAGLHNEGKRVIILFDEASKIADVIWEVTEGALTDAMTQIIWVAFGNPTRNMGRFRECFRKFRRFWGTEQIDSRTVEGTNQEQAKKWESVYDEDSDFMKVRVRGVFPSQSAMQMMSEKTVTAAQGRHLRKEQYDFAPIILTLDNAWTGEDSIVMGFRQGLYYEVLWTAPKNDNDVEIADKLARYEDELGADAVFIDGGYGTGVVSVGKTWGRDWILVWFGEKSADEACINKRAEMAMKAKDWLESGGAIDPDDAELAEQLLAIETVARVDGKIQLVSKEVTKLELGCSPDKGDNFFLTFAHPVTSRKQKMKSIGRNIDQVQGGDYDPLA